MSEAGLIATLIGATSAAIGAAIGVLAFWLRFSDAIARARARADSAEKEAGESKTLCDQAHTRITALHVEFGIYRERVAIDYVSKEAMRELKNDLVNEIKAIDAKLDQVLAHR